MTTVPSIDDMDNETFLKHMDARHASDFRNGPLSAHPDTADEWVGPYREFHERLHELAVPGQYDHEHLW
jgi:hypothetical protein